MCGQHIDRKCEKCGWGLPLLERRRLKVELKDQSPNVAVGVGDHDHLHGHGHTGLSTLVTRVEALGGKPLSSSRANLVCDPAFAPPPTNKRSAPTSPAIMAAAAKEAKLEGSNLDTNRSSGALEGDDYGNTTSDVRLTRPWKTVYCERLVVERNWRKGRCVTKTLNVSQADTVKIHLALLCMKDRADHSGPY